MLMRKQAQLSAIWDPRRKPWSRKRTLGKSNSNLSKVLTLVNNYVL